MTYSSRVLALTRHFAKLSISPESSDGFASVGTILPKEEATLLPGGLFAFFCATFGGLPGRKSRKRKPMKKSYFYLPFDCEDDLNAADAGARRRIERSQGGIPCLMLCILRCRY
jgi:hypothetical protein